jgi:hypothetical protein
VWSPSGVRGQSEQSVQSVRSPYGLRTEYQGDSKDLFNLYDMRKKCILL